MLREVIATMEMFDEEERTLCVLCGKSEDCDCATREDNPEESTNTSSAPHCKNKPSDPPPISMLRLKYRLLTLK